MELHLAQQMDTQIRVICDGRASHSFDLQTLIPNKANGLPQPLDDPVTYGKAIYQALFPPETPAARILAHELQKMSARILLVTGSDDLDAVSWEYAYAPDGFLILESHFLRGVPVEQRIAAPIPGSGLHIVAIPSDPLARNMPALNINDEWMRLKENIENVPFDIALERTRPPTIEQIRTLLVNQRQRIVHFMGHGEQDKDIGAFLCFEKANGELDSVTARQFLMRVRGTVFLVTLNACVSATPGPTPFSNLAAALVRGQIPYALGMRFSIFDDDARSFSRVFYNDLARGSSVEEALLQARLTLASSRQSWAIGVPVLYTSLAQPASGFTCTAGTPTINEYQPRIEVSALPRAEGAFQGRIDELKRLGSALTGDKRPRIITIHGGGGQGKTALAREAVERFAYAWSGGVWAISLENLVDREIFVTNLARFLGIPTQEIADPAEVERRVFTLLMQRRILLVLDNAETFIDAVDAKNTEAINLGQFIQQLPGPSVSLLVTSRVPLGWSGEELLELGGLSLKEGVDLFLQCTPRRRLEIEQDTAIWELSEKLEGHPLGLRLLAGAFDVSHIPLADFMHAYDQYLLKAEDKYRHLDHRHHSLNTCIEVSVQYLDADSRSLLSGLWIFHASFPPEAAAAVFDPEHEGTREHLSTIHNHLHLLYQRGLLTCEVITAREGTLQFYHLLPTTRPYVEHYLQQAYEPGELLARFGVAYDRLVNWLDSNLHRSATSVTIAQRTREDLVRGAEYVADVAQGYYLLHCGWILHRLGYPRSGQAMFERSLEIAQGQDQHLELQLLNNMGLVYQATGRPQEALKLLDQALPIHREVGDRAMEAITLNNLALIYQATGKPQEALKLYQQALPILREVGRRAAEASTLNGMGEVYRAIGRPQEALTLFAQALPIRREVQDRVGEAITLNNMALVYQATGQPQEALKLFEQALPILREMGDRAGEAAALSNMALVYQATGQVQEALKRYQQVLPVRQEVGDRAGEATTLNNMAAVHHLTGQTGEALKLYEQALPILQEVGDRAGEAITLSNMGEVYYLTGKPQEALRLYQQALPIRREVGDRAGEATTLNNMAVVYHVMGQPQEALTLFAQALPIHREAGNRAMEATTLINMGEVYRVTGKPREALKFFEQALPIMREVGNRSGEATTLNNRGLVYQAIGQPQEALKLFEQTLPIMREVGNRSGEATTLNNLALVYHATGQPQEALRFYERALPILREVGNRSGEALVLRNMAMLLYQHLDSHQKAITVLDQAITVLREASLSRDAAGRGLEDIQRTLKAMQNGEKLS